MQTRKNGEDRFLAFHNLLVQHIVSLIELGQAWRAIDDSNGIDIVHLMFAIVDNQTQLLSCSCGQDINRVGHAGTRK